MFSRIKLQRFLVITGLACLVVANHFTILASTTTTIENPPYSEVTKLTFREANHKIAYGNDPNQYGLLWLSDKQSDTLVVFIHGGCWLSAFDISHTYAATTAIADAGYPVWSLEYRRTGKTGGGWPTTFEDIKAGISAITKLDKYKIKADKIVIAGHSAGGHLALLAGAMIKDILPGSNETISIAGLAAITDLEAYANAEGSCQSAGSAFMGGKPAEQSAAYQEANPVNYEMPVKTVLFQGKLDPIVPTSQAEALTRGEDISIQFVESAGHFDWVHPGTTAFRKFLDYLSSDK